MRKLVIALIIGWIMIFIFKFNTFSFMENFLSDNLIKQSRAVDSRIKIIAIDPESIDKIGKWPWPRDVIADLVDKTAAAGAAGVWPNVLLSEKSVNPDEDQALSKIIAKYDNVFIPVIFDFSALKGTEEEIEQNYIKMPVIDVPMEQIGHANILPDEDNVVRNYLLGIPTLEERIIPIIGIRLANLLLPQESQITCDEESYLWYRGSEQIILDDKLKAGLYYASVPGKSQFDIIPAWKVIQGEIDPAYFQNSIVIVGPYNISQEDEYTTPMGRKKMSALEIHANITQAFLDNKLYHKISESSAALLTILAGMFAYPFFSLLRIRWRTVLLAAVIILYLLIAYYYLNSYSALIPSFYVVFALILSYTATLFESFLFERGQPPESTETAENCE